MGLLTHVGVLVVVSTGGGQTPEVDAKLVLICPVAQDGTAN